MKEPILQDKRAEHVQFQRHALDLIKAVSGGWEHTVGAAADVSMQSIHRADVVAQTKIQYNKKQLLQLIQNHLAAEGFDNVVTALQQAAHLPPLPHHTPMGPPSRCSLSTTPSTTRTTPSTAAAAAAVAGGVGASVSCLRSVSLVWGVCVCFFCVCVWFFFVCVCVSFGLGCVCVYLFCVCVCVCLFCVCVCVCLFCVCVCVV
ncbi:Protein mahjong [Chionoecetes opilio]|uniref:Protein mahjong n=1 Tax=Chionoecetes opilio TaxID=41210 RepID=A0A8J4YXZ6_CHIOP|nr:Protein mahjong [Chionoecetes opilio]